MKTETLAIEFKDKKYMIDQLLQDFDNFHKKKNAIKIILGSDLSFTKKIKYLIPVKLANATNIKKLIYISNERQMFLRKKYIDKLVKENNFKNVINKFEYFFDNLGIETPVTGDSFNIFNSYYSSYFILNEILGEDMYNIEELINENDVVIDAGANIGAFSLLASTRTKNSIFAFEPFYDNYKILLNNIKKFNVDNIFAFADGLGDENKYNQLRIRPDGTGSHTYIDSEVPIDDYTDKAKEKTYITTLDTFVKQRKIKKVDVIKMDIEGYELKALLGAKETIKKFKPKMMISAYHSKNDVKDILDFVLSIRPDYKYKLFKKVDLNYFFY